MSLGNFEKIFGDAINNTLSGVSPVHKINVDLENTNCALGAFMILEYDNINPQCDTNDINDNTIIYIDTQTLIERAMIIAGAAMAIKESGINTCFKSKEDIVLSIIENIKPCTFSLLSVAASCIFHDITYNKYLYGDVEEPTIVSNLWEMLQIIWFLPFTEINRILDLMQKDIDKLSEEKKNE